MTTLPSSLKFAVLAVDVVVFTIIDGKLHVLLSKNERDPFKGQWVLPGSLVQESETLEEAVKRNLYRKTTITECYFEQIYTFGDPNRDPRSRVVSVAYIALIPPDHSALLTISTEKALCWKLIDDVPKLGYDHNQILSTALDRLRSRLTYTNIIHHLMSAEFTLTQLQTVYENVLGHVLDKRNFRRKLLSLGLIEKSPRKKRGEANRPAQLYRFVKTEMQIVEIL